jgi:hypothetical protein
MVLTGTEAADGSGDRTKRLRSPLVHDGGSLNAMPLGFVTTVKTRAIPATNSWQLIGIPTHFSRM